MAEKYRSYANDETLDGISDENPAITENAGKDIPQCPRI
jgi:hypothetical protein